MRRCASAALALVALGLCGAAHAEPSGFARARPAGHLGAIVLSATSRGSAAASYALVDLTRLEAIPPGLADDPTRLEDRERYAPFDAKAVPPDSPGAPRNRWFANVEDKIPIVSFLLRRSRVAVADGHELTLTLGWPPSVDVTLSW